MGEESEQRRTMAGLGHARGYVQSLVAARLRVRQCPEVRFHLDESIKRGTQILRVIAETMGRSSLTDVDVPPPSPSGDDA